MELQSDLSNNAAASGVITGPLCRNRNEIETRRPEILSAALKYAQAGWRVFPLFGKKPLTEHGFKDATTDPKTIEEWWAKWPWANVGIATGDLFFVLDVDVKPGGFDSLKALQQEHGALPATLRQTTGGGGVHYFFRMPIGREIKNSTGKLRPGLDIRASGGYIVAAPSVHPANGWKYKFEGTQPATEQPIAEAPDWLLDFLDEPHQIALILPEATQPRFELAPVVPEGTRNDNLFRMAAKLTGVGLRTTEILPLVLAANDTHCKPPLPFNEVVDLTRSAARYPPNVRSPALRNRIAPNAMEDWRNKLSYTATGKPERILANAVIAFQEAPHWQGAFAYDELALRAHTTRRLCSVIPENTHVTDPEISIITTALQSGDGINVSSAVVAEAVFAVAKLTPHHPVRDYLRGLVWDEKPRLDSFLTNYLDVKPSRYSSAVGSRWMISAVARVMRPGCQADSVLILQGPQGSFKSTALRILGGDWFSDDIGELGSKDTLMQMQGKWIIELSELDALSRAEATKTKSFITRQIDNYRPPYGRASLDVRRQAVFAGTTNHDVFLKDETGNRRFWPVRVGKIDLDALRRDRDQLWAEAYERYRAGEAWHLNDPALQTEAEEQQRESLDEDVWQSEIEDYCTTHSDVSIGEILTELIDKPKQQWTQQDKNRVGRCLKALDYERYRPRDPGTGARPWRYRKMK